MVKYKVEVDRTICVATGACYAIDTLHYRADPSRKAEVVNGETDDNKSVHVFDDNQMADAQEGAKSCPVSAITVTQL